MSSVRAVSTSLNPSISLVASGDKPIDRGPSATSEGHNSGTARPIKVGFSMTLKARGGLYDGKRAMRAWGLGRA